MKKPYHVPMQSSIDSARNALFDFFVQHPRLTVLTGAGISAGSGIPTYRDSEGNWLRNDPITHQDFTGCDNKRRRYWGRSLLGWPGIRDALPNAAHLALAALEREDHIELLITQNVDRLHQRAGSSKVVDLHGRLDQVVCLACKTFSQRELMQQRLEQNNPHFHDLAADVRPDGDADLSADQVASVVVPPCEGCGGDLMPDVVFFGGSVPAQRVTECTEAIARADALLVVGSSLRIFSGYRFCRGAAEAGKPIVIINPGVTRADSLATLKLAQPAESLLPFLSAALHRSGARAGSADPGSHASTPARIHRP